jgi:hypothetical protein
MAPTTTSSAAPLSFRRDIEQGCAAGLLLAGWELRGTAVGRRLEEMVDEYRRIGFDVELVEHRRRAGACHVCYEADALAEGAYRDVYVRPKQVSSDAVA